MGELVEVILYKARKPRKLPVRKSLKRKGTKRRVVPKHTQIKRLKAELWQLCKEITRKRYGNTCYTCDAVGLVGGNWHTAHFIASSICGLYLRYDLRNLRPGCYRCNVSLAGNGANYYRRLVEREGQAYVDAIFADKGKIVKGDLAFFAEKVAEYRTILEEVDKSLPKTIQGLNS